ncbi:hypothetical protein [Flavobacterium sp. LHD-85]|uniref:hypothetical protein n=1 Tax=Flavobacterium sp. LHD-85 TaxID=3071410 RepID=UPI0027DF7B69|nr:hypothetical protein [Flavobacterium sp. LHD-85]MDQ6531053.1 hypothetical protein [Flavobacterium sp. LHD-85]
MRKTKLDYINISLTIILVVLVMLNFAARFKNKEQDKILWNAEIHSYTEDSQTENSNIIQIVEASLHNNFNQSVSDIDSESKRVTSAKSEDFISFKIWQKELLPDSLNLKYFSIDERKFYLLQTHLPYEKMKNLVKDKNEVPFLILEVQPKGKILLKIRPNEENAEPKLVETFVSKETTGDLNMLVYETSLGEKYNRYPGIESITDYADLLQNQFKWSVKIEKEDGDILKSVYANSFKKESIDVLEDNDTASIRSIPSTFYIYWENKKNYSIQYTFSPIEILTAFRKLNANDAPGDINFNFKIYKNAYAKGEISKNGVVIPLKDAYPEKP